MRKFSVIIWSLAIALSGHDLYRLVRGFFNTPSGYVNVLDYGAVGDGVTDDAPGIVAAIQAADKLNNGNFVYFPPVKAAFVVKTPLQLPGVHKWTLLYLDSALVLEAPLIMNDLYILHGNSATIPSDFSQNRVTNVFASMNGQSGAPIQVHGKWGVRFENLAVRNTDLQSDAIRLDGTSGLVTFDHVVAELNSLNTTGAPLHILGGSFIQMVGGRYSAPAASSAPSIWVEGDPNACSLMGMFKVADLVTINRGVGIIMDKGCGVFAQMSLTNVLYEDGDSPFLTTVGLGGSLVAGVYMNMIGVSDAGPNATCIGNTGRAWSFQVFDCITGGNQPITQGDPILDLEAFSAGSQAIGQSSFSMLHSLNCIVNTMPTTNNAANLVRQWGVPIQ